MATLEDWSKEDVANWVREHFNEETANCFEGLLVFSIHVHT